MTRVSGLLQENHLAIYIITLIWDLSNLPFYRTNCYQVCALPRLWAQQR